MALSSPEPEDGDVVRSRRERVDPDFKFAFSSNGPDVKILIASSDDEKENKINNNRNDKDQEFTRLSNFLPHRFDPDDLMPKDAPILLEPHRNDLSFCSDSCNSNANDGEENLKYATLDATNMSYAPYSMCLSGVALVDVEGKIYRGSYMESTAYNSSVQPVQAVIVAYIARGGGGYERIVRAVLVEKVEGVIKQEHAARLLLLCISPKCEFKVKTIKKINKVTKSSKVKVGNYSKEVGASKNDIDVGSEELWDDILGLEVAGEDLNIVR
ncbi:hypothetical protein V6N13_006121 [Hibiscus sabdariffa]|uniref:CMP/dCMP-type deaminase domain-containing protein n=1 Tax=Hibiscus sabdariffa TaxID=183260 RepID=A0ABR2ESL6_9ROSI